MEKRLLDVFSEDFFREMRTARTNPEAYDKATQRFEREHGFTPYKNYDSFRVSRHRKLKKKGKR